MTSFLVGKSGGKAIMTNGEYIKLTPREEEIYFLLVTTPDDLSKIANELCASRPTVATWTQSIYQKMGVNSRRELIIKHYAQLIQKEIIQEET